jgi:hypothetical protein
MKLAEGLESLLIEIDSLNMLPDNPRRGNVEAIKRSLDRFGQMKPIVYRMQEIDGKQAAVVIAGNHTVLAARELGWDQIAGVDASLLSDEEASLFALADNRVAELGTIDNDALRAYLASIEIEDPSLYEAASFSQQEVDRLLASITQDQFVGFLDDLIGSEAASWNGEMEQPESLTSGLVPFNVMVTVEQRKEIMGKLRALVSAGTYETSGEALAALVLADD